MTIKEICRWVYFTPACCSDAQLCYSLQVPPHGLGYGPIRLPPFLHQYSGSPYLFAADVDFGATHPEVHLGTPGAMYGSLGPHAIHFYNQGAQFACHRDGDPVMLRNPILEDFLTNRSSSGNLRKCFHRHTIP